MRAQGDAEAVRARLHARIGNANPAIAAATQALRSPRDFIREDALVLRAALLLEEGQVEQAGRDARAAAVLDPHDARPARFMARVHRASGRKPVLPAGIPAA